MKEREEEKEEKEEVEKEKKKEKKKREISAWGKKSPPNQMTNEKLGEYLQLVSQIRDNLLNKDLLEKISNTVKKKKTTKKQQQKKTKVMNISSSEKISV